MKKGIIIGIVCGGVGLFAGYKICTNEIVKMLNSEDFKNKIINGFEDKI